MLVLESVHASFGLIEGKLYETIWNYVILLFQQDKTTTPTTHKIRCTRLIEDPNYAIDLLSTRPLFNPYYLFQPPCYTTCISTRFVGVIDSLADPRIPFCVSSTGFPRRCLWVIGWKTSFKSRPAGRSCRWDLPPLCSRPCTAFGGPYQCGDRIIVNNLRLQISK